MNAVLQTKHKTVLAPRKDDTGHVEATEYIQTHTEGRTRDYTTEKINDKRG